MLRMTVGLLQRCLFSTTKEYYPYFLAEDYTPLQYASYYVQRATRLRIDKANIHQVNYTTLPQFLHQQITNDKSSFIKEKELLFVGRSNTGKSSLINAVFHNKAINKKKKIARTAKKPGTTRFLHFHQISKEGAYVVDAPGYGFARMNRRRRELWLGLADQYLKISSRLSQIFHCIHFQHGLKNSDIQFLRRADQYNVDIQIVLTKVDKMPAKKFYYQLKAIVEGIKRLGLTNVNPRVLAVSSKTGFGVEMLRMRVVEALEHSQQRNIDYREDLLLAYVKDLRVQRVQLQHKQKSQSKQFLLRKLVYNSRLTRYLR